MLGVRERPSEPSRRVGRPGARPDLLFFPTGSAAELQTAGENLLGLHQWPGDSTHRIGGSGERLDLLFFATRSGGELRPGAETAAAASDPDPAADNTKHSATADAKHPTATDASPAADVEGHPFTYTQQETVTRQRN